MINRSVVARCATLLALGGCASGAPGGPMEAANLAITRVNVVDVQRGRIRPDQTVLIGGGRILRIAPSSRIRVSPGARVVDATGQYLIPGLLDMHAHLVLSGRPTEIELPLFVANGVTGVRVMIADCRRPAPNLIGCLEGYRDWQKKINAGELTGPRLLSLGSWSVNGPAGVADSMPSYFKASTAEEGRQLARYFKQRGVDFVKIYQNIPREGYLGLAEEARKIGLQFAGHEPSALSAIEISNAGQASIEHARVFLFNCFPGADSLRQGLNRSHHTLVRRRAVDEYDAGMCSEVFRTFVRNGTWNVPTHLTRKMDAFADDSAYRNDTRMKYLPAFMQLAWKRDANGMVASDSTRAGRKGYMDFYRRGLEITGAAHRAGVKIMLGTDAGDSFVFPGSSVHDELEELILAGLTPAQALKTATWNGAEFLGRLHDFGSVETGRSADLVLIDGNPLQDIRNTRRIHGVVRGGRYLDRPALDAMLVAVEAAARR